MAAPVDEGRWDPKVVALAHAVKLDDPVLVDRVWERLRLAHGIHLRRDTGADPLEFAAEALHVAEGRGLLRALAIELINQELVLPEFEERLTAMVGATAFNLQLFVNGDFTPKSALVSARRFLDSCDRVCRIDVDGRHHGTGVLVRPTLVATAAHVVQDLVRVENGVLTAVEGSREKLTLTFGYAEDYLPPPAAEPRGAAGLQVVPEQVRVFEGEVAEPHEQWLAWGSLPTASERLGLLDVRDIAGITESDGPWDLALIRLAEPRRVDRRTRLGSRPPGDKFPVHVLHHPGRASGVAEPLLWSIGQLDEQLGAPAVRYLHDANTVAGSSGAPLFDDEWRVVALHQGGGRTLQAVGDAPSVPAEARNRAVPVCRWLSKLDELEDVVPYLQEVRGPAGPQRVVGRRGTQERLWRALREGAPAEDRLLIVRGEPDTGLRFTKRLVGEYVRTYSDGVVVALDVANALGTDAAGFAEHIAGTLSAELDPACGAPVTTGQSQVRNGIAPRLGAVLDGVAGRRAVWLVFEGFDRARVSDQHGIDNLLLSLIGALPDYRTVRLVMVSWQQTPPDRFALSVEDLKPPTAEDVAYALVGPGGRPGEDDVALAEFALERAKAGNLTGYRAAAKAIELVLGMLKAREVA
ncbi:trypsin-like peptidase domain-containing protein [Saccharothrix sp.]|uniref:trypsin-like serine peptidase n=1 Tax=Saccharothrix sp. TaxID=1873460 RepID=UPI0028109D29|nr:trypsin-like peptidase domain-containing protein [Saccharothrix sp.]